MFSRTLFARGSPPMPRQHGHLRVPKEKTFAVISFLPVDRLSRCCLRMQLIKKKCLFILLTAAFCDPFPKTTNVYFYFLKVNTCHPPAVFWGSDDLWAQSMPSARVWVTSVSWSRCVGGWQLLMIYPAFLLVLCSSTLVPAPGLPSEHPCCLPS